MNRADFHLVTTIVPEPILNAHDRNPPYRAETALTSVHVPVNYTRYCKKIICQLYFCTPPVFLLVMLILKLFNVSYKEMKNDIDVMVFLNALNMIVYIPYCEL